MWDNNGDVSRRVAETRFNQNNWTNENVVKPRRNELIPYARNNISGCNNSAFKNFHVNLFLARRRLPGV